MMNVVNQFKTTPKELWISTKSEVVNRFISYEIAIYDSTKEQGMEKLKLKIAAKTELYMCN